MPQKFFAYLTQPNTVACDMAGNARLILQAAQRAHAGGAVLMMTPAHSVTGAPLHTWTQMPDFWIALNRELEQLAADLKTAAPGLTVVVGAPAYEKGEILDALYVLRDGGLLARATRGAAKLTVIDVAGVATGFVFAEELLDEKGIGSLKALGATLVCAADDEPYTRGVSRARRGEIAAACAKEFLPLILANLAGGQDELIFEGASLVSASNTHVTVRLASFAADEAGIPASALFGDDDGVVETFADGREELLAALVCGVRDYTRKNGFTDVLLGLSGGADSALVAAIAVEALGKEHVHAVMMPARFTTDLSVRLAKECGENLGIDYRVKPVGTIYDAALSVLSEDFAGTASDLTEENLQARSRGITLMALSNKFGWLTLATGNKSEASAGYCTLYGDTVGGYSPIKDVFKTEVWELMRTYNRLKGAAVIPEEIITRAPSAELSHGQTDEAALMPYAELDAILRGLLEEGESVESLADKGLGREKVERVLKLFYRSEFKRRQCPTGPRVSLTCLGAGVSLPMTSRPSFP